MAKKTMKRRQRAPLTKNQYKTVAKIANKQIYKNQELKVLDSTPAGFAATDQGDLAGLKITYPVQGVQSDQRIGDSIYLRQVSLRGLVNCGSDQNNVLRVITVQWLEDDNTVACTLGKILADTTVGNILTSHYKVNPQYRFKIIDDSEYFWDSNTASAPKPWSVNIKGRMFARHKPDFQGTASVNSNGSIYVFVICDTIGSPISQLHAMHNRVRYFDA